MTKPITDAGLAEIDEMLSIQGYWSLSENIVRAMRERLRLAEAVIKAADAAVQNDKDWYAFDYQYGVEQKVPEDDMVFSTRMEEAIQAYRAATKGDT